MDSKKELNVFLPFIAFILGITLVTILRKKKDERNKIKDECVN